MFALLIPHFKMAMKTKVMHCVAKSAPLPTSYSTAKLPSLFSSLFSAKNQIIGDNQF